MDDHIQRRSPLEQKLIELETDRALSRNGLARTGPLRDEILARGQIIYDYREPVFRVPNDQGILLTADGFIDARSLDPRYKAYFPTERLRVSRHDQEKLTANLRRSRAAKSWWSDSAIAVLAASTEPLVLRHPRFLPSAKLTP
jgi:hypothetical protein